VLRPTSHYLRAEAAQMRVAFANLQFAVGTGPQGQVLNMGAWGWPPETALPELQPLLRDATPRQRRDHRFAEGLRSVGPSALFDCLLACREIMADVVEVDIKLRADGYGGNALVNAKADRGESLLTKFRGVIGKASGVQDRLNAVRADLASEYFETGDANRYLSTLGLREPADSEADPPKETAVAVQAAVYDVAIAQALKPLTPAEKTQVLEQRALPAQLNDPRVLAALFRAPLMLLPFDDDEMRGIAALAFARNWPKTASVAGAVSKMLDVVQPVAGEALWLVGQMIDPTKPAQVFERVPGGAWALQPLARRPGAAEVLAQLGVSTT
jgi:hypothetical protein